MIARLALGCFLTVLAIPCHAQTADEFRQQLKALQNQLNRSLRTGQPLTGEVPAGGPTDADISENERNPMEVDLEQMNSALVARSYYDARGALHARGYSMQTMIRTNQDAVERCPIGDEAACQRFREVAQCWRAIGLQCDMAWRSADAQDEPDVIVSVIFDRLGLPKVTGVQSVAGRAAEQRAAELAATERQRAEQEERSRLYINLRKKLLDQGFKPAFDNGGEADGSPCSTKGNPWVCKFYKENSHCVFGKYCVFEWTGPNGKPFRVTTTDMGLSDTITVLDMKYVNSAD